MDTQSVTRARAKLVGQILTDKTIRGARPKTKPYKMTDGLGMYLLVSNSGSKYFRLDYRLGGHRKTLALGVYPRTTLKEARDKLKAAKDLIAGGIDPVAIKRNITPRGSIACDICGCDISTPRPDTHTLETVTREWLGRQAGIWSDPHLQTIKRRLEADVLPWLGTRSIADISSRDLLTVIRRIDDRGAHALAGRLLQNCGQIFRYALSAGLIELDPTPGIRGALTPTRRTRHMPTLTDPRDIGRLLRDIDRYQGHAVTRCALQLAPLVFVRPGELRQAEWQEIDFGSAKWRIPAGRMKSGREHIVPLSRQALDILKELRELTGTGRYVFPPLRADAASPTMGATTVILALKRLGYGGQMTGHGFRAMASTLLNEQGWDRDIIERQLAHADRDKTRAAYNHAQHIPKRHEMMQAWADYLDSIKADGQDTES